MNATAQSTYEDQISRVHDKVIEEIRSVLDAKARSAGYTLVLDVAAVGANGIPIILFTTTPITTSPRPSSINSTPPPRPRLPKPRKNSPTKKPTRKGPKPAVFSLRNRSSMALTVAPARSSVCPRQWCLITF